MKTILLPLLATLSGLLRSRAILHLVTLALRQQLAMVTAPRSPWQNPYVERLIGSVRRDCLDHVIVLNERHLKRLLRA